MSKTETISASLRTESYSVPAAKDPIGEPCSCVQLVFVALHRGSNRRIPDREVTDRDRS